MGVSGSCRSQPASAIAAASAALCSERCPARFAVSVPGAPPTREEARRPTMLVPLRFDREAHLRRLRRLWLTLAFRRRSTQE
jgi:hypothetical protein